MVRRDPMNVRGPAPPGGRSQPKKQRIFPQTLFELRPIAEYQHLWNAAFVGADHSLGILEGYTKLGLPGTPGDDLQKLRDRLDKLILLFEARHE